MDILRLLVDRIWAAVTRLSGWHPASRTKNTLEWISTVTGALLGIWGIIAVVAGQDSVTPNDIDGLRKHLRQIEKQLESQSGPDAENQNSGVGRELDKAIETLIRSGHVEALKDKTGAAAEAAIDQLIEQRAIARRRLARDEADLYRQKGAFAFLNDTQKALALYKTATELDPDEPFGWNQLGRLHLRIGEMDAAATSFERAIALATEQQDRKAIATATGNLALIHADRGALNKAEALLQQALKIDEELNYKEGLAADFGYLGNVYLAGGKLQQAEAIYRKSLELYEGLDSKEGMASAYGNMAIIHRRRGDYFKAEAVQKMALSLDTAVGYKEGMAAGYRNLAAIAWARGSLNEAEAMQKAALGLSLTLGRKESLADDYTNLGLIHQAQRRFAEAEIAHKQAISIRQMLPLKPALAEDYANLGIVALRNGDRGQACNYWRQALGLYERTDVRARADEVTSALRGASCPSV
jgi:tetratricopeptide (TPR) repeat protein